MRFTSLDVSAFNTRASGETVFETGKSRQNIWEFPIGFSVATKVKTSSGWTLRPSGDLSFVPVTGDRNAHFDVALAGWSVRDSLSRPVMDSSSVNAGVGLTMERKNMSFSLNYALDASSHQTWQTMSARFGWRF